MMRLRIYRAKLIACVAVLVLGVGMATGATIYLMSDRTPPADSGHAEIVVATGDGAEEIGARDPYDVYLERNPDPDLVLSRKDAMARAYLGCSQTWPPGTIDAVLADAYRPYGICDR